MTRSAAAAAHCRHVVFVGVAAVGKTTLGALTAPLIAMPFADTDLTMERWHAVTIEELSQEPGGDGRIDQLLWQTYQAPPKNKVVTDGAERSGFGLRIRRLQQ